MIARFQSKIMQYDDHVIQLLQLFDELHRHIIHIISLHHYHNQYHDIFLDKHQVLESKHEDRLSIDVRYSILTI
jgi:hypothetical protein